MVLPLHSYHEKPGVVFGEINGQEVVHSYGSVEREYLNLTRTAALLDLSFRGRICVLDKDRERFLHGQITNDVLGLKPGQGCYAAITSAKGKIESDVFLYKLKEEILLDFEPGLTTRIIQRLEKYVIAENVQIVDVSSHYGLLSVQGPSSQSLLEERKLVERLPERELSWTKSESDQVEIYMMKNSRLGTSGFDLFVPVGEIHDLAETLNLPWAGWQAFEIARIEGGIPRFGVDMTEVNLPQEAEIQDRAVSFTKGCYIGQEVIARIRTYGQAAKSLRLLRMPTEVQRLVEPGEKLFKEGKEVGYITSSALSPKHGAEVALGYVRKESNSPGSILRLKSADGPETVIIGIPGKS